MPCDQKHTPNCHFLDLLSVRDNIFSASKNERLNLTQEQMLICSLHLIDGHSQKTIARWLRMDRRTVIRILQRSIEQEPRLKKLLQPVKRPRILLFSQLKHQDRSSGPFNPDDI